MTFRDYLFLFHLGLPPFLSILPWIFFSWLLWCTQWEIGESGLSFSVLNFPRYHSNWLESWPPKGIIFIVPSPAATWLEWGKGGEFPERRCRSPQEGVWDEWTEQEGFTFTAVAETLYHVGSAMGSRWGHLLEEWINSKVLWLNGYFGYFQSLVLLCPVTEFCWNKWVPEGSVHTLWGILGSKRISPDKNLVICNL